VSAEPAIFGKAKEIWAKPWVRHGLTAAFFLLVCVLLIQQARTIEWVEVKAAIQRYDHRTLAMTAGLSFLSYLIYSWYDLLGRHYIKLSLSPATCMGTAFMAYAFNQSLGALIGTVGFRARLYSRHGLTAMQISKIIAVSIVTNWLGYAVVAGVLFVSGALVLPEGWDTEKSVLQVIGGVMLAASAGYLILCAFGKQREVGLRHWRFKLPSFPIAMLQFIFAVLHWPLAAAIVYLLLDGRIEYVTVLGALLLTAVAVVLTHIPAGIGVLEAILLGILKNRIPAAEIVAALLVFRAIYYLAPLLVATAMYLKVEATAKPSDARGGKPQRNNKPQRNKKKTSARADNGSLGQPTARRRPSAHASFKPTR
jgi:uncharacterized membrane protein YbhN (UPF0104 family)